LKHNAGPVQVETHRNETRWPAVE